MKQTDLERYARLIVQVGAHVQPGQWVRLTACVDQVPLVTAVQTKQELSRLWSKPGCSMAAITDVGIAAGYADALAEAQPEQYADVAALLAEKNRRAAQRRTEKRAADHNKRVGKRRNNT